MKQRKRKITSYTPAAVDSGCWPWTTASDLHFSANKACLDPSSPSLFRFARQPPSPSPRRRRHSRPPTIFVVPPATSCLVARPPSLYLSLSVTVVNSPTTTIVTSLLLFPHRRVSLCGENPRHHHRVHHQSRNDRSPSPEPLSLSRTIASTVGEVFRRKPPRNRIPFPSRILLLPPSHVLPLRFLPLRRSLSPSLSHHFQNFSLSLIVYVCAALEEKG